MKYVKIHIIAENFNVGWLPKYKKSMLQISNEWFVKIARKNIPSDKETYNWSAFQNAIP